MKSGVVYNISSGKITKGLSVPDIDVQANCAEGEAFLETTECLLRNKIVVAGAIVDRPTLTITISNPPAIANGMDVCLIIGVPAGAEVTSKGTTITADGNDIEFVTDIIGEHKLQITLWPYQDAEVTINAI